MPFTNSSPLSGTVRDFHPQVVAHAGHTTNATLLISQQVDVATVSARLGHAQITTTYNFYVHPLKSHDRTAGNVLENLLISSKTN